MVAQTVKALPNAGFQPAEIYNAVTTSVAIGDFNGDGKLGIATSGAGAEVLILFGAGDGTFVPGPIYPGSGTMAIATGDFDGDGRTDLAVLKINQIVDVFHGNGDGTFRSLSVNTIGAFTSGTAAALAIGDFNGDGRPDIAEISNFLADPSTGLSILIGKGDGTFAPPVYYNAGAFPISLAVADFNADGIADLVVTDSD